MKPRTRHKRRILRYRRRNLTILNTFKHPTAHYYGYQLALKFDFSHLSLSLDATSAPDWKCLYKYDPHSEPCQGYHLQGCDRSCDRIRQMQLRRLGKI